MDAEEANPSEESWYPTIFFFDLKQNKVVWEIFGAEVFIGIDLFKKVTVLTNEIWIEIDSDEFEQQKLESEQSGQQQFSRHHEYDNYVWKVNYMSIPPEEELVERRQQAPEVPTQDSWKLTFGANKTLEITDEVKVVEAYMHNSGQRFTLVYKNLGSFTFVFKNAKSLLESSAWHIKYDNRSYRPNLKFNKNRLHVDGSGKNEDDDSNITVKIDLRPE